MVCYAVSIILLSIRQIFPSQAYLHFFYCVGIYGTLTVYDAQERKLEATIVSFVCATDLRQQAVVCGTGTHHQF